MEFTILDANLSKIGLLDVFESAIWTERYTASGDFEFYTKVSAKLLELLSIDNYVIRADSERAMVIENHTITTDIEEGNKLSTVGRSLESILDRRVVQGQKIITGNFQNGIELLLNENFIDPIDTERKVSNFIFIPSTDTAITELIVDAQYFGTDVLTIVRNLCSINNVGFKVVLNDGNFEFSLYAGADRSYSQIIEPRVIFSPEYDNLLNSDFLESKKTLKTIALIAGEGEGDQRVLTTQSAIGGSLTGLSRREMFVDAKDVSKSVDSGVLTDEEYVSQLQQRGVEKLSEAVVLKAFEGQVEASMNFVFGESFFIGDIVQIENEYGITSRSRVTEVVRSESTSGSELYPTFTKIEE